MKKLFVVHGVLVAICILALGAFIYFYSGSLLNALAAVLFATAFCIFYFYIWSK